MNDKLNIVAIIPARHASTRLPGKPLVDLCGKPMVQHVVEQTQRASLVSQTVVATDDERIASVVRKFGGTVVMTPSTCRTGSDRIAAAAKSLPDADIIVNVQGDEPLIEPEMIDQAIRPLTDDRSIHVGTLIKRITDPDDLKNPNVVKVALGAEGFALYFSRSPIPFLRNGIEMNRWLEHGTFYKHIGIYVFQKETLLEFASWQESALEQAEQLEQLRLLEHGRKIKATLTTYDSVPVDTEEDAQRVRRILSEQTPVGAR